MNYRKLIAVITMLLAIMAIAAFALQIGQRAPDFNLNDQFGKRWTLGGQKNSVTALVIADRDSGRAMGPWVDNLKSKYGSKIQVLGLMDLHSIPAIGRGIAKSRIRSETKDPLMLDFDGATAKSYLVSGKHPVAVVIGKSGTLRAVQETDYNASAFGKIASAIDEAVKGNK